MAQNQGIVDHDETGYAEIIIEMNITSAYPDFLYLNQYLIVRNSRFWNVLDNKIFGTF